MRGSKPGERRGGRRKGIPNKATQQRQAEVEASGLTPLDYMLQVMRDEETPKDMRLDAAKAAAAYVHPKLAAIDHTHRGDAEDPITLMFARIASQGQRLIKSTDE